MGLKIGSQGWVSKLCHKVEYKSWVPGFGLRVWSQGLGPKDWSQCWVLRFDLRLYTRVGSEDKRLGGTQCLVPRFVLRLGLQVGSRGKVPSMGPIPSLGLNARS